MGERFDVVCCSVVVVFGLGCARGAPEPDGLSGPIVLGTADAAIAAAPPMDAGSPGPAASAPPTFTGTACKMGDQVQCTCADGMQGAQLCHFDATSPTMGALGSCEGCKAPALPPSAGSGAAGMASAGSAGAGRSGSFAGSGAAGSTAAASGGAASAGSGGSAAGSAGSAAGGSAGSAAGGSGGSAAGGSGAPDAGAASCDPDKCPDPGGLRRACCTDDGQCGGRLLGNCSVRN